MSKSAVIIQSSYKNISLEQALAFPGSSVPFHGGRTLLITQWEASASADGCPMIKLTAHVFGEEIKKEQP